MLRRYRWHLVDLKSCSLPLRIHWMSPVRMCTSAGTSGEMDTTTFEYPPFSMVMVVSEAEIRSRAADIMETAAFERCIFDRPIITGLSCEIMFACHRHSAPIKNYDEGSKGVSHEVKEERMRHGPHKKFPSASKHLLT